MQARCRAARRGRQRRLEASWSWQSPRWRGREGRECRRGAGGGWRVIEQDPTRGAVEVVELAGFERPKESGEPAKSERQSHRDEQQQPAHARLRARRSALPTTTNEELDMAAAASNGVISPSMASGTASRL